MPDRAIRLNLLAAVLLVATLMLDGLVDAILYPEWFLEARVIEVARILITMVVFGLLFLSVPFFVMHLFCSMMGGKESNALAWVFVGICGLIFLWRLVVIVLPFIL